MYIENKAPRLSRAEYEARARFERSAVFHNGLARIVRVFRPRAAKR